MDLEQLSSQVPSGLHNIFVSVVLSSLEVGGVVLFVSSGIFFGIDRFVSSRIFFGIDYIHARDD